MVYIIGTYLDFFSSWLGILVNFHYDIMQGTYLYSTYCTSHAQINTHQIAVDPEQKKKKKEGGGIMDFTVRNKNFQTKLSKY